jgi:hypothetical protein
VGHQGDVSLSLGVRSRHRQCCGDPTALVSPESAGKSGCRSGRVVCEATDRTPLGGGVESDYGTGDRAELSAHPRLSRRAPDGVRISVCSDSSRNW